MAAAFCLYFHSFLFFLCTVVFSIMDTLWNKRDGWMDGGMDGWNSVPTENTYILHWPVFNYAFYTWWRWCALIYDFTACGSHCSSCVQRGAGKCDENKCVEGFGLTPTFVCDRKFTLFATCAWSCLMNVWVLDKKNRINAILTFYWKAKLLCRVIRRWRWWWWWW